MTLLAILFAVVILVGVVSSIMYAIDPSRYYGYFSDVVGNSVVIAFLLCAVIFVFSQLIGTIVNTETITRVRTEKIVALKDVPGIKGEVSGGFISIRGSVEDTQNFSFYKDNGDGTYSLDKREAYKSFIHTDATPETARLDITEEITTCETSWWSMMCSETSGIYIRGDFHVPPDSIQQDFSLDAQ